MWRRNESAVISNSTASPRSRQRASATRADEDPVLGVGRGEGAEVVLADEHRRRGLQALRGRAGAGCQSERSTSKGERSLAAPDAVAVGARRAPRSGRGTRRAPPRRRATARSRGSTRVERLGGAAGRRAAPDLDRDDVGERVDAGVGAAGDRERPGRADRPPRAPRRGRPRPSARRAGAPSRESRCRRRRRVSFSCTSGAPDRSCQACLMIYCIAIRLIHSIMAELRPTSTTSCSSASSRRWSG